MVLTGGGQSVFQIIIYTLAMTHRPVSYLTPSYSNDANANLSHIVIHRRLLAQLAANV